MILATLDRRVRPARVPPVGAEHESPPVLKVAQIDGIWRLDEDERPRVQQLFLRSRVVGRVGRNLGKRHVPGSSHERLKHGVGHRRAVHPETVDSDAMDRAFLRVVLLGTHLIRPPRDPDHVGKRCRTGRRDHGRRNCLSHDQLWHKSLVSINPRASQGCAESRTFSSWRRGYREIARNAFHGTRITRISTMPGLLCDPWNPRPVMSRGIRVRSCYPSPTSERCLPVPRRSSDGGGPDTCGRYSPSATDSRDRNDDSSFNSSADVERTRAATDNPR